MAVNQDALYTGVPLTVRFTEQAVSGCVPPSILDAFRTADWRADFPSNVFSANTFTASTIPDNLFRLDSTGAGYVPAISKTELSESTVTITDDIAPGIPVTVSIPVPGLTDLANSIPSIYYDITPPDAAVRVVGPAVTGNVLRFTIFRLDVGGSAPYPVVVVKIYGRVFTIPSASPL